MNLCQILNSLLIFASCFAVQQVSFATSLDVGVDHLEKVNLWSPEETPDDISLEEDDSIRRDRCVSQANKLCKYSCGVGVACLSIGLMQTELVYQMGALLAGASFITLGGLVKHRADKAANVFNRINDVENGGTTDCIPWKDGTYKRVDRFSITPSGISWDHALQAADLEANYAIQFMKFLAYRLAHSVAAKEPTEQEIIRYALNSTILTLLDVENNEDHLEVKLDIKDLSSPFFADGRKTDLYVVLEIPEGDHTLQESKIVAFRFDGHDISKGSEQLLVLSTVTALYIHPLLHSFANNMYEDYRKLSSPERKKWNDMFIHSQYLNSVAHTYPADNLGISRKVAKKIYSANVRKDLHDHGKTVKLLSSYSRFSKFLLGMRRSIYSLVEKHKVPVNPESFFLTSVMHSLDHLTTGRALLYRNLDTDKLRPQANPHMLNYMWYLPSENVFTNLLKDKKGKNEFYRELYDNAKSFDAEYADHLTLSISY